MATLVPVVLSSGSSRRAGDIDAVAHEVAVGLLDDVAQMDADAELYAVLLQRYWLTMHGGGGRAQPA